MEKNKGGRPEKTTPHEGVVSTVTLAELGISDNLSPEAQTLASLSEEETESSMANDWIDDARKQRELGALPKYGPINPQTDKRCFIDEAVDELLDALNYSEWSIVKGEIGFCDWVLIERQIKFSIELLTQRNMNLCGASQVPRDGSEAGR